MCNCVSETRHGADGVAMHRDGEGYWVPVLPAGCYAGHQPDTCADCCRCPECDCFRNGYSQYKHLKTKFQGAMTRWVRKGGPDKGWEPLLALARVYVASRGFKVELDLQGVKDEDLGSELCRFAGRGAGERLVAARCPAAAQWLASVGR